MSEHGVQVWEHYQPLHISEMGRKLGRAQGDLSHTQRACSGILRLPIYPQMANHKEKIVELARNFLSEI